MSGKFKAAASVVGVLAAIGVFVAWVIHTQPRAEESSPSVSPLSVVQSPVASAPAPGINADNATVAPWQQTTTSSPQVAPALPPGQATTKLTPDQQAKVKDIQAKLLVVQQQKNPDVKEATRLISELQSTVGSKIVGGVDLEKVKANMEIAGQIQQIANDIQALSKNGNADTMALNAKLNQLKQLQSGLNPNVTVGQGN